MALDPITTLLRERFGFAEFRPGQRAVIDALVRDGRALALFPTGAGKTLCAQLPALLFEGVTLVISPLIALMKDQIDVLLQRGIPAARLDSSLSQDEVRAITQQLHQGTLKLLYVAPERFNNERFLALLQQLQLAMVVIDEAHSIAAWGHNFRPEYLKLAQVVRELGVERVLALTATATPAVIDDICDNFAIPRTNAIVTSFYRPNLHISVAPTALAERTARLLRAIRARPPGSSIVYVTQQKTAEELAEELGAQGIEARAYHAGLDDHIRAEVQEWWTASATAVVVATIAFAMGIDKADVRYVYHYNLPKGVESYTQEIGRAGRDGERAVVESLGSLEDLATLENFVYGDTPTPEALHGLVEHLVGGPPAIDISVHELANQYDMRPLVARTALTYLELAGLMRQGSPVYTAYRVRLQEPLHALLDRFSGERRQFLADVFNAAHKARIWHTINPTAVAQAIGADRERIVRALDYLSEQGALTLEATDVRQQYTRLIDRPNRAALVATLDARFREHEAHEIGRLQTLVAFLSGPACITNALLAYFGEQRSESCGYCSVCRTSRAAAFPSLPPQPLIDQVIAASALATLRGQHPQALHHPRQAARFLTGLSSPALTRAKLTRHALFGVLAAYRFAEVERWLEA